MRVEMATRPLAGWMEGRRVSVSALREAAHRYSSTLGWPVFPCVEKRPLTCRGLLDASADPATIERWWQRWPDANVAIRTGAASGLVVVDVDGDDGHESLRRLEADHEPLPVTASVKTPRGGHHYYLRHPGATIANSAGALGASIDVRADGGYVIAPPSIGADGRRYEPDEQAPVAPAPEWLLLLLSGPQNGHEHPPAPACEWVAIVRDGLPEGQRNHGLARLVGHLLAKDVHAQLVAELAQLVNGRARPPLPAGEVDRIVESIAGRELRKRTGARG